jgi:hypothetical protein
MRIKTNVLIGALLASQLAYANVENGEFESWSGSIPDF